MSAEPSPTAAWGMPLQVYYCPHCHSAHLAPERVVLDTCPACLQAGASPEPTQLRREPPELVIPFRIDRRRAEELVAEWAKGGWFRPDELRADLLSVRLRTYYLPVWLVDCDLAAVWQAEMGYDYQAASFRERYQGGHWVSEQTTETRVRWEPRTGRLRRRYDNVAVPAMEAHDAWMSRLAGYDLGQREPYIPQAIEHGVVRVPDYAPESAWPDAEQALDGIAALECKRASEADHVRNWAMQAQYEALTWTQMLVPSYVTWYREGDEPHPVWINGQSGHVHGPRYASRRKARTTSLVMGGLAALLFLIGMLLVVIGSAVAVLMALGGLMVIGALLLGLLAPIPVIWAWLRNRNLRAQEEGQRA
jgi:hypothetical protein